MRTGIYVIFLLTLILVVLNACSSSSENNNSTTPRSGKEIFKSNCVLCHGIKGNLGTNGAFDLTDASLSLDDRIKVITEGRNTMTAFESVLTEKEIMEVAKYTMELNENLTE